MRFISILFILLLISCTSTNSIELTIDSSTKISFSSPIKVTIIGYTDNIMEPFLSRDGATLFFNNLNQPPVNTNLHFATRIDDITFQYQGELKGVNTESLEGVPTLDTNNHFYFVSTRSYDTTLSTLYQGNFNTDTVTSVKLIPNLSKNIPGWLNFDAEISKDGSLLFFVDGRFDQTGGPHESNLVMATKINTQFVRVTDNTILQNINTNHLEYAACISSDKLELYFTRLVLPITATSLAQIYVATRPTVTEPFGEPYKIDVITGFAEGATISPDDKIIYYHKKENYKFVLYSIRKN